MKRLILLALLSAGLSFGAIVKVNTARGSDVTGSSITTLTTGPGTFNAVAGNTQIVFFSWFMNSPIPTTASITDHAGNTYTLVNCATLASTSKICAYISTLTISDAVNTISATPAGTGQYPVITTIQYSGVALTSMVDFSAPATNASSSSLTTSGFTTTQADEVLIFGARNGGGTGLSYTAGSLYTIEVIDADGVQATEARIVPSIQTSATVSMSCTTTAGWLGVIVGLKADLTVTGPRIRVISQQ